jgi:hypothetical protein
MRRRYSIGRQDVSKDSISPGPGHDRAAHDRAALAAPQGRHDRGSAHVSRLAGRPSHATGLGL